MIKVLNEQSKDSALKNRGQKTVQKKVNISKKVHKEANYHLRENSKRIQEHDEMFKLLVQSVKDYAIFILDPKGNIATWNIGAERLKGYQSHEIIGRHFSNFYSKEDKIAKKPERELKEAIEKGRVWDEGWRIRKDGTRFWAHVNITALRNKENELVGFSKVTRDMTERKDAEEALLKSYDMLEHRVAERTKELRVYADELMRSNADLQQFAYVASHDLQEPLRIVSMYADLLGEDIKKSINPKHKDYLRFIQEGALRAQRLINELLEYSRIGAVKDSFTKTDMNVVVKHVLSLLDLLIAENKAVVTVDPLPTIAANRFQMEQLFQNLITNAIKYRSKETPSIHISAEKKEEEWLFSVKDNGIGIDPEYHSTIFIIFKRLHTPKDYPGTGIGLAFCKKIVEFHGGKIWVESKSGSGSTFLFTLGDKK